jgi:puromycin-sensitive aminopeptidase
MVVKWPDGAAPVLADKATQTIPWPKRKRPAHWFGNASAGGFYRVLHDAENCAALLADLAHTLLPVERMALVGDQWALVRGALAPIESFLDVAAALGGEQDYDVLDALAGPLSVIDEQIAEPGSDVQVRFRRCIARRFGPAFKKLGWAAAPGEADGVRLRRGALLRLVGGVAEAPDVVAEAGRRFDGYLADRASLEPNLAEPVVGLAARGGDEARYEHFLRVAAEARTPQERRRFLLALGAFRTPATIRRTLASMLSQDIPTQDVGFVLMRLLGNPAGRAEGWKFLTKRWTALRKRMPPLMLPRLIEATPSLREPRYAKEVAVFFRSHPVPEASRAIRQALEVFRLNAELRRRATPGLERWLSEHTA